jgi:curli production assembly/transport component CsgF
MKKLLILVVCILAVFQLASIAQDFVYQPINPAFGGNPYNYSWLLSSATAQNEYREDTDPFDFLDEDLLSGFQDDLNSQILNEISRSLYYNQFGEEGLSEGFYEFGSYEIDVSTTSEGMQIRIIDIMTGSETTVVIPFY